MKVKSSQNTGDALSLEEKALWGYGAGHHEEQVKLMLSVKFSVWLQAMVISNAVVMGKGNRCVHGIFRKTNLGSL